MWSIDAYLCTLLKFTNFLRTSPICFDKTKKCFKIQRNWNILIFNAMAIIIRLTWRTAPIFIKNNTFYPVTYMLYYYASDTIVYFSSVCLVLHNLNGSNTLQILRDLDYKLSDFFRTTWSYRRQVNYIRIGAFIIFVICICVPFRMQTLVLQVRWDQNTLAKFMHTALNMITYSYQLLWLMLVGLQFRALILCVTVEITAFNEGLLLGKIHPNLKWFQFCRITFSKVFFLIGEIESSYGASNLVFVSKLLWDLIILCYSIGSKIIIFEYFVWWIGIVIEIYIFAWLPESLMKQV